MNATRTAVEEAVVTLAAKVITAVTDDNPGAACQYTEALDNACRSLSSIAEAQREDRWEGE